MLPMAIGLTPATLVSTAMPTPSLDVAPIVPAAAPAATSITLSFAANPVPYDATATARGVVTRRSTGVPVAGRPVTLFGRAPFTSTWKSTGLTTTTSSTGAFAFGLSDRTSYREFQARSAANWTWDEALSPVRLLTVRAPITNLSRPRSGSRYREGETATWRGTTHRSLSGSSAEIQVERHSRWSSIGFGAIGDEGGFVVEVGMDELGTRSYRVYIGPSASLGAVATSPTSISVA